MKIKSTNTTILNHGRNKKNELLIKNSYTTNRLKAVCTIKPKKLKLGFEKKYINRQMHFAII